MFLLFALLASVITIIGRIRIIAQKMGMTSHISDAYDAFSSYCISSSLLLSLMKRSLMTNMMMMFLGLGSPPVCAFPSFLYYLLILLVNCNVM